MFLPKKYPLVSSVPFQILPISKAQLKSYTFLRLSLITPVLSEHLLFQIPMVHVSILLISLKNTQPLLVLYALSSLLNRFKKCANSPYTPLWRYVYSRKPINIWVISEKKHNWFYIWVFPFLLALQSGGIRILRAKWINWGHATLIFEKRSL